VPDPAYYVSPYCVAHPLSDGTGILLVHGLYGSRFELSADLLTLVGQILHGVPPSAALAGSSDDAREAIQALIAERVLIEGDEFRKLGGDAAFRNRLDPIALAFHRGFNIGGYFPDTLDRAHPPAIDKEARDSRSIDLASETVAGFPTSLEQCLAGRRSIRAYAVRPMEKEDLAHFLRSTARAFAVIETPDLGRLSMRNYPSGGARYPLEVYPVVYDVRSVEPGIYYYHPFHHRLLAMDSEAVYRDRLQDAVRWAMGRPADSPGHPAVLLVVTAVFARTCWKYRGIPYHLILQEVGALYQTMYLAATVLGLAPCAVGAFPELAIDELLQLDARDEAQVGLFALGVPAEAGDPRPALVVDDVRLLEGSPFSPNAHRRSVELRFRDGRAEIIDLARFGVKRHPDGRVFCSVMRGRHEAELTHEMAARLTEWLARHGARADTDDADRARGSG